MKTFYEHAKEIFFAMYEEPEVLSIKTVNECKVKEKWNVKAKRSVADDRSFLIELTPEIEQAWDDLINDTYVHFNISNEERVEQPVIYNLRRILTDLYQSRKKDVSYEVDIDLSNPDNVASKYDEGAEVSLYPFNGHVGFYIVDKNGNNVSDYNANSFIPSNLAFQLLKTRKQIDGEDQELSHITIKVKDLCKIIPMHLHGMNKYHLPDTNSFVAFFTLLFKFYIMNINYSNFAIGVRVHNEKLLDYLIAGIYEFYNQDFNKTKISEIIHKDVYAFEKSDLFMISAGINKINNNSIADRELMLAKLKDFYLDMIRAADCVGNKLRELKYCIRNVLYGRTLKASLDEGGFYYKYSNHGYFSSYYGLNLDYDLNPKGCYQIDKYQGEDAYYLYYNYILNRMLDLYYLPEIEKLINEHKDDIQINK